MRSNQHKPARIPDEHAKLTLVAWLPDGRLAILKPEVGLRNFYVVVDVVESLKVAEKLASQYGLSLAEPIAPIFTEAIEAEADEGDEANQSKETADPPKFLEKMADEIHEYIVAHPDIRLVDVARDYAGGKHSYSIIARAVRLLQVQGRVRHYRLGRHKYVTTRKAATPEQFHELVVDVDAALERLNGRSKSRRSDQEVDLRSPNERAQRFAALLKQKDEDNA